MPSVILNASESFIPPDLNNPPFYIPLKNIETRYNIVQELGKGSFGSVTLAEAIYDMDSSIKTISSLYPDTLMDQSLIPNVEEENWFYKNKGIVAVKTMMNRLPTLHDYTRVREIKFILQIPAHKNLVTIYEMFIDDSLYHLHIVMECMEQNIYQLMKHRKRRVFSLPTLRSILFQILSGIKHIHDFDFFHRDIKPENILISPAHRYYSKKWLEEENYTDNYIVKLADYGLARHINNRSPYTTYVSTRWYRSPEILLRKGYYSKPLDMWAYGCVVVELATFSPLFPGSDEVDQVWRILNLLGSPDMKKNGREPFGGVWTDSKPLFQALNYEFPYVEGKTIKDILPNSQLEDLYEVVSSCLKWNPDERLTALEIGSLPYFKNCTFVETIQKRKAIESSSSKKSPSNPSQWARILSGLPQKSDKSLIPSFHSPQKLNKEQIIVSNAPGNENKKNSVASWFKFTTTKNQNAYNLSTKEKKLTDSLKEIQSEKERNLKVENRNNIANIDNELFTIELDDSMETVTGSEEISKELEDSIKLYEDDIKDEIPALEVDHNEVLPLEHENYRIDVLNDLDADENLAREIKNLNDEDEGEDEDPDSLLSYYQEILAKKLPQKPQYVYSNQPPHLMDHMAIDDSIDLQEQVPRNLVESSNRERLLGCLLGTSDHQSQNVMEKSNSNQNHTFQDGLSF